MKHRRILIVEDDDADAALVGHALQNTAERFRLLRAKSLEEARLNILRSALDLVIVDLDLPDSRGLDTLHKIVWSAPGMPVILVTGVLDPDHELLAIDAGAVGLVTKSDLDALLSNVRYALSRHRFETGVAARVMRSTVGQFHVDPTPAPTECVTSPQGRNFTLSVPIDGMTLPELLANAVPSPEATPRDRHQTLRKFATAFVQAGYRPVDVLSTLSELESAPHNGTTTRMSGFGLELMTHLAEAFWRERPLASSPQSDDAPSS